MTQMDIIRNTLKERIGKQKQLTRRLDYIDEDIHYYENHLKIRNNKSYIIKRNKLEGDKDIVSVALFKAIRSIFLYLNRNKKYIFSFEVESRNFWKIAYATKIRLLSECTEKLETTCDDNKRRCLALLITTLENYREDYGLNIGLVLNRLFYWPIPHLISEYL